MRKGTKHTLEARQKISKSRQGQRSSFRGKKHTLESRQKMSDAKRGKHRGKNNPNWRGGYCYDDGYIRIWSPSHPHADRYSYVLEHRLVMEQFLGRYLESSEVVHHINGIKDDNRKENLTLFRNTGFHLNHHLGRDRNDAP